MGGLQLIVTDPVCRRPVRAARAGSVVDRGGHSYYFCSAECGLAFVAGPEYSWSDAGAEDDPPAVRRLISG